MRRIRRADNLACRRTGLRNSGDISLAFLARQARELGDMAVPLRTRPIVARAHIEVRLNQDGGRSRLRAGRLNKNARVPRDEENRTASSPRPSAGQAVFSPPLHQQSAREQRVHRDKNKADAVNAGERRELIDENIVHLRVAKLVPRNARDARRCKVKPRPQKRRKGQSHPRRARRTPNQHKPQPKNSEVKPEHQTESQRQQLRRKKRHVAVMHHRVANPVAVAHVPQHAAKVGNKERAAKRMPLARFHVRKRVPHPRGVLVFVARVGEQRPYQRHQRNPRKHRSPRRHRPGERERQLEQAGGKSRRGPRSPAPR